MAKATWEKTFANFLQTVKVFPTMYYTSFAVTMALLTYFHMWPETNRSNKSGSWHKVNGGSPYTLKLTPQQKTIVASTPLKTHENLTFTKQIVLCQ